MGKPKRHHIVPKSYLENFTNQNGQLHVIPKTRGSVPFVASTDRVAVRKHYHSSRDENGVIDVKIENALGSIENIAKPIIDNIIQLKEITPQEKIDLAVHIGIMFTRNPNFRDSAENFMRETAELFKRHLFANSNEMTSLIEAAPQSIVEAAGGKENIRQWACENLMVKVLPEASLHCVRYGLAIADLLNKMHWRFWVNTHRVIRFLTSDNPCYVTNKMMDKSAYGSGIAYTGSRLHFPISPAVFLIADWNGNNTEYKTTSNIKTLNRINSRTIRHAEKEVYSSVLSDAIQELIKKNKDYALVSPVSHVGPSHIQRRKLTKKNR